MLIFKMVLILGRDYNELELDNLFGIYMGCLVFIWVVEYRCVLFGFSYQKERKHIKETVIA